VTFRLTLVDFRSGVRRLTWALSGAKVIAVVTVLAFIGAVAAALLAYGVLAVVLFVGSLVYAAMLGWILVMRPGRQYQRRADVRGEQTFCFSDSDISLTFVGGDSRVKWSYFVGVLETKDSYVLRHPLKQLGTIIPKRAFSDPDVEARFRRLAQHLRKSSQPPSRTPA
jgi:YcxB-like protein